MSSIYNLGENESLKDNIVLCVITWPTVCITSISTAFLFKFNEIVSDLIIYKKLSKHILYSPSEGIWPVVWRKSKMFQALEKVENEEKGNGYN